MLRTLVKRSNSRLTPCRIENLGATLHARFVHTPDGRTQADSGASSSGGREDGQAQEGAAHGEAKHPPHEHHQRQQLQQQQQQVHWLDRRFPGTRDWLENKSVSWWLKSVSARCRQRPELTMHEPLVLQQIERRYQQLMQQYKPSLAKDGRAHTHLQVGCLVLATHRVLGAWVKDERELLGMLREHVGEGASPVLRALLRVTSWLLRDPFRTTVNRLRALQLDYGEAFDGHLDLHEEEAGKATGGGAGRATLTLRRCLYYDLFEAEGAEHLLPACCCSQDAMWFDAMEPAGVGFELHARHHGQPEQNGDTTAVGQGECKLVVFRRPRES